MLKAQGLDIIIIIIIIVVVVFFFFKSVGYAILIYDYANSKYETAARG